MDDYTMIDELGRFEFQKDLSQLAPSGVNIIIPYDSWCELCQMMSHFSDSTPYGTCQCS